MSKTLKVAIIGVGPRGLAALEALFLAKEEYKSSVSIQVLLFEDFKFPGAGPIWNPDQVITNLSNVSERHLLSSLTGRKEIDYSGIYISGFPSYAEWSQSETQINESNIDYFPPRARLGTYLYERFESIKRSLVSTGSLTHIEQKVVKVSPFENQCKIIDVKNCVHIVDEVVLTVGHQNTQLTNQLEKWKWHSSENKSLKLFEDPYPVGALETSAININSIIALRGFGLTMIDQLRALTIGFGGEFVVDSDYELRYIPSEKGPKKILVFSLDGLPPVPKPLTAEIDNWFKPTENEYKAFRNSLDTALKEKQNLKNATFFIDALATLNSSVYRRLGDKARQDTIEKISLQTLSRDLINNSQLSHILIADLTLPASEQMQLFVNMAVGNQEISLDYCLGQVWRYVLGIIYKDYTYLDINEEILVEIVQLIEASKRYSYGPPVLSLQQLIAVHKAGVLDLNYVLDPKIKLHPDGWELYKKNKTCIAETLVNSVVDPPQLTAVTSKIITSLLADLYVNPVGHKLGLHTLKDGRLYRETGEIIEHIAFLGRLAKGSVIGVDDLIECFGKPVSRWASGIFDRLK
ncbi:FAD/NAD(P)-binding protein [Leeuwenhoekiella aequorea]|uniref:FAD/NAD(P)-binding protein n=1 Tax=Leeuwenhoekiella aequorea TaxID=283736 RepID=UPI00352C946F